jgi:hypothetical protein
MMLMKRKPVEILPVVDTPKYSNMAGSGRTYTGGCDDVHEYGVWHVHMTRDDDAIVI